MSETCNHDCNNCGETCSERSNEQLDFSAPENSSSHINKVIGVVSGKGGVGKSLITSLMAVSMCRRGHKVAILDADITGPSIPKSFGIHDQLVADEDGIIPAESRTGIKLMSVNLMLKN